MTAFMEKKPLKKLTSVGYMIPQVPFCPWRLANLSPITGVRTDRMRTLQNRSPSSDSDTRTLSTMPFSVDANEILTSVLVTRRSSGSYHQKNKFSVGNGLRHTTMPKSLILFYPYSNTQSPGSVHPCPASLIPSHGPITFLITQKRCRKLSEPKDLDNSGRKLILEW